MNRVTVSLMALLALAAVAGCGAGTRAGGVGDTRVASITITPSSPQILRNRTRQLGTVCRNAAGESVSVQASDLRWTSDAPLVADVNSSGLVSGKNLGTAHITVVEITSGVSQTTTVQVVDQLRRRWTVMVYMDADGDLEQYGVLNMNQMEAIGSTDEVSILLQFDRGPGYDSSNGNWTDTRRFVVEKDTDTSHITSPVVENLGEVDMADPSRLQQFITWAKTDYPADHYALFLWNHGGGWRSRAGAPAARGIIFDDTSETFMTMAELRAGMAVSGMRYDLVGIDCSLMGMLEVCYEIRSLCDHITASEESPPGSGYPYHTILADLVGDAGMSGETLGRSVVRNFLAFYAAMSSPPDVTQSLIATSGLADLAGKADTLANAIMDTLPGSAVALSQARANAQTYKFTYYRDLYDVANQVHQRFSDPTVRSAAQEVMDTLVVGSGGPVVAEGHAGAGMARSHGLSIYLPGMGEYVAEYRNLRFIQDQPNWDRLARAAAGL